MAARALLILSDGFEDIEAVMPIDVLNRVGVQVTVAGLEDGPVRGAYGCTILPSTNLSRLSGLYDALILPGGKVNAQNLASSRALIALIREHISAGKLIAAICAAPALVLGRGAGVLEGRRTSGAPETSGILLACGAIPAQEDLTVDGNIITAAGPGAALAFALKLAELLAGASAAQALAEKWRL